MRIVVQRVSSARVTIDGRETGSIQRGLLVLLGIEETDTPSDGEWLAQKIAKLRIFDDADGKMNLSLLDLAASTGSAPGLPPPVSRLPSAAARAALSPAPSPLPQLLLISQFTLFASTQKGTRPSFHRAAKPALARPLYDRFITQLTAALGHPPATGGFGAMMQVELVNDGPVTLVIDSKARE